MPTCGEAIALLLKAYGVDTVFGIPGVHTLEMYRGLAKSGLRHVTARHEQGAALMAHGYALATGRPAACFLITGPGILNAATSIAGAYADSAPMLVFCSANQTNELGMGAGRLHEIPSQYSVLREITDFTHTLLDPNNLPELFARAFARFRTSRPRPICIEIPTDVLARPVNLELSAWPIPSVSSPESDSVQRIAEDLNSASRPLLLFGGGCSGASAEATELAEILSAPVLLTQAAKGVVPETHPLCLGFTLPFEPARQLIRKADLVLAVGTELSEVDRYMIGEYEFTGRLIRVDICASQLTRNYRPDDVLLSDARTALKALNALLVSKSRKKKDTAREASIYKGSFGPHWLPRANLHHKVIDVLQSSLPPHSMISADSCQLTYAAAAYYNCVRPRSWFFPSNLGSLGTALPISIGARIADGERPTICIAGDGGFMFTIEELAVAVEQKLPITILLWNNGGYGEIRDSMDAKKIPYVGVEFGTPDFIAVANGLGCEAYRVESLDELRNRIGRSLSKTDGPTLIEIREDAPFLIS